MKSQSGYVPPAYIPLGQSDLEPHTVHPGEDVSVLRQPSSDLPVQWSSGICACCDDMPSCCIGLLCPWYLFGRNAEFLGSGTFAGSCLTHFILCASVNAVCCFLASGLLVGLPGYLLACYARGYRRLLREKYNLQDAPCGDLGTHFFCHLCAICQEYREIRERSGDSSASQPSLAVVTAPPTQTMDSPSPQ